jgi:cystathionine gamma-synthase
MSNRKVGDSTGAVHAGALREKPHHALTEPIVQSSTYTFADTRDLRKFMDTAIWGNADGRVEYGRYGNPTVAAAETRLAALEGAGDCVLCGSGMAATTLTLLALLSAGTHVVITDDSYRRTREFCLTFLKRFGVPCTVAPTGDYDALEAAIRPETKLLVSESPTNPYLRCLDLQRFAEIGRRHKVKTLIDATFATPLNLRPLEYGIDLVLHSGTKYLGGHNDLLAGAVCGSEQLTGLVRKLRGTIGAVLTPQQAFLLIRGLKTLGLRIARHNENGQRVAEFLESHAQVKRVWYPGLPSHPDHAIAKGQMRGYGGVVSFEVPGGLDGASRLVDAVSIPYIAPSLGGVETLIEQPALMSYYELEPEERLSIGIKDNLVRISVGIEDADDIISDLEQALAHI